MKVNYLLITMILLVLSVNVGMAQSVAPNDSVTQVEKEYRGETYVIKRTPQNLLRTSGNKQRSVSTSIWNKDEGELKGHSAAGGCYGLKETVPLEEVIKKAISKEKIALLALNDQNNIAIKFDYNMNTGKVVNVHFILHSITPLSNDIDSETEITLKDISNLESLFKEYYFDVPKDCVSREKETYGHWVRGVWFYKLVEEENKE